MIVDPEFVCSIDWGLTAAWVGALATLGLVLAAYLGFDQWKKQFIKQRDHDLALRVLQAVSITHIKLDEMRSPVVLISDFDLPLPTDEYDDVPEFRDYRVQLVRYRARRMHLSDAVEDRIATMNEVTAVWDEFGMALGQIIGKLADMESAVQQAVWLHVDSLNPNSGDSENPNRDVLYSPADHQTHDAFADEYEAIIEEIHEQLGPKIRMD